MLGGTRPDVFFISVCFSHFAIRVVECISTAGRRQLQIYGTKASASTPFFLWADYNKHITISGSQLVSTTSGPSTRDTSLNPTQNNLL